MRTIYLDCGMGAAGDMLAGALFELIKDKEGFLNKIQNIGLDGVSIEAQPGRKCGICGTHMRVTVKGLEEHSVDVHEHSKACGNVSPKEHCHTHHHAHHHTALSEIYAIIDGLAVSEQVKQDVKAIYQLVAEAESKVHGERMEEVHFHEVGMKDAVADITMTAMLMEDLAPEQVIASPVNVGFGKVHCAHGILPVPAPATLHLLEGIPCYAGSVEGELCTPTGAALLQYYADRFENLPRMTMECVGYGMGNKDFPVANCIRAVLGETENAKDEVIELRCNVDDMTPEETGYAMELFLEKGALDVYTVPIGMKKSRTGTLLTVMCLPTQREEMIELMFKHTSTIGLREYQCNRVILKREEYVKSSIYGDIRMKRVTGFGITREKPEYEDLKKVAERNDISIREVKDVLIKREKYHGEAEKQGN